MQIEESLRSKGLRTLVCDYASWSDRLPPLVFPLASGSRAAMLRPDPPTLWLLDESLALGASTAITADSTVELDQSGLVLRSPPKTPLILSPCCPEHGQLLLLVVQKVISVQMAMQLKQLFLPGKKDDADIIGIKLRTVVVHRCQTRVIDSKRGGVVSGESILSNGIVLTVSKDDPSHVLFLGPCCADSELSTFYSHEHKLKVVNRVENFEIVFPSREEEALWLEAIEADSSLRISKKAASSSISETLSLWSPRSAAKWDSGEQMIFLQKHELSWRVLDPECKQLDACSLNFALHESLVKPETLLSLEGKGFQPLKSGSHFISIRSSDSSDKEPEIWYHGKDGSRIDKLRLLKGTVISDVDHNTCSFTIQISKSFPKIYHRICCGFHSELVVRDIESILKESRPPQVLMILHEGILDLRKNASKNRRLVRLLRGNLVCFSSEDSDHAAEVIPLCGHSSVELFSNSEFFKVKRSLGRDWLFKCKDEVSKQKWVNALEASARSAGTYSSSLFISSEKQDASNLVEKCFLLSYQGFDWHMVSKHFDSHLQVFPVKPVSSATKKDVEKQGFSVLSSDARFCQVAKREASLSLQVLNNSGTVLEEMKLVSTADISPSALSETAFTLQAQRVFLPQYIDVCCRYHLSQSIERLESFIASAPSSASVKTRVRAGARVRTDSVGAEILAVLRSPDVFGTQKSKSRTKKIESSTSSMLSFVDQSLVLHQGIVEIKKAGQFTFAKRFAMLFDGRIILFDPNNTKTPLDALCVISCLAVNSSEDSFSLTLANAEEWVFKCNGILSRDVWYRAIEVDFEFRNNKDLTWTSLRPTSSDDIKESLISGSLTGFAFKPGFSTGLSKFQTVQQCAFLRKQEYFVLLLSRDIRSVEIMLQSRINLKALGLSSGLFTSKSIKEIKEMIEEAYKFSTRFALMTMNFMFLFIDEHVLPSQSHIEYSRGSFDSKAFFQIGSFSTVELGRFFNGGMFDESLVLEFLKPDQKYLCYSSEILLNVFGGDSLGKELMQSGADVHQMMSEGEFARGKAISQLSDQSTLLGLILSHFLRSRILVKDFNSINEFTFPDMLKSVKMESVQTMFAEDHLRCNFFFNAALEQLKQILDGWSLDRIIHTKLVFTPIYMIVALEFLVCLRIGKLVVLDQAISSWKAKHEEKTGVYVSIVAVHVAVTQELEELKHLLSLLPPVTSLQSHLGAEIASLASLSG